jgi:hypothetical protein
MFAVAMGQLVAVGRNVAPGRVVFANRLRITRLLVVVATAGRDVSSVCGTRHQRPGTTIEFCMMSPVFQIDVAPLLVFRFRSRVTRWKSGMRVPFRIANANARQILAGSGWFCDLRRSAAVPVATAAAGPEVNSVAFCESSVTIFARDLDRRARLVVEIAVAVRVLAEMTIDAVHAAFEMNVVEMHRLA